MHEGTELTYREKLIYLAGVADGEGHFYRPKNKNGQGREYYESRIVIVNTNRDLIDWMLEHFAGSRVITYKAKPERNEQEYYRWSMAGKKAEKLAAELEPFLTVKKKQVRRVLDHLGDNPSPPHSI